MKTFTKISLILLVSLALVMGSDSLFARDNVTKEIKKKTACCQAHAKDKAPCQAKVKQEHKTVYVCPVEECEYHSDKPGKCPKCGKELVKKEVCCTHAHQVHYVCPTKQCDYKSDKPGKCPTCDIELKKVEPSCSAACAKKCDHTKKEKTQEREE